MTANLIWIVVQIVLGLVIGVIYVLLEKSTPQRLKLALNVVSLIAVVAIGLVVSHGATGLVIYAFSALIGWGVATFWG